MCVGGCVCGRVCGVYHVWFGVEEWGSVCAWVVCGGMVWVGACVGVCLVGCTGVIALDMKVRKMID